MASFQTKFGDTSLMAKLSKSFQENEMRDFNLWILELNTAYAEENILDILGLIQKNEIPQPEIPTTPTKPCPQKNQIARFSLLVSLLPSSSAMLDNIN